MMNAGNTVPGKATSKYLPSLAVALLALGGCGKQDSPPLGADEHAAQATAHHDHEAPASPTLPPGTLWPTDAPLRAAMGRIEGLVAQSESAYETGTFKAADALSLASQVEQDVRYMIENCKLEPQADAALHGLIGRMMSAAGVLKKEPLSPEGVPALAAAVHDYRTMFDQNMGEHEPR